MRHFEKVLTAKIFVQYSGVIINGCVNVLDNIGVVDVASILLASQYLSNNSFPNQHVDMVASINSRHFVVVHAAHLVRDNSLSFIVPAHALLSFPTIRESFNCENPTFSNSRKFSPAKDSHYTVVNIPMNHCATHKEIYLFIPLFIYLFIYQEVR